MKKILMLLTLVSILSSCSKDEEMANQLEGSWTTTYRTKNGANDMIANDQWVFNQCSDVTQGNCSGTYTIPSFFGPVSYSFIYVVYNNGTQFSIDFPEGSVLTDVNDVNIVEQTSTTIEINFKDSNGDYYEQILTKQ